MSPLEAVLSLSRQDIWIPQWWHERLLKTKVWPDWRSVWKGSLSWNIKPGVPLSISLIHTHHVITLFHPVQIHKVHTSSSFTVWSVSIGSSPSAVFTTSTSEALDTLNTPWTLTRTFTLTFALSPDAWGTTFWTRNWPVGPEERVKGYNILLCQWGRMRKSNTLELKL